MANKKLLLTSALFAVGALASTTTDAAVPFSHPWFVKAVSDQVVNYCCFAGMLGGMMGGGDAAPPPATVSFSTEITQTFSTNTATTLTTTIPGSVVTIYGSQGGYSTTVEDRTYTTVYTPTPGATGVVTLNGVAYTFTGTNTASDVAPTPQAAVNAETSTAKGLRAEFNRVQNYAHALADAIVAPEQMTHAISSAYNAIIEHGFVHATQAVNLISQASGAFEALRTDPAYAKQSQRLAAQPTPINFQRAVKAAAETHSKGLAKLVAEPAGPQAIHSAKVLADNFIHEFARR